MAGAARGVGELRGEEFPDRTSDVGTARITDRVEPVSAFLFRQDFQFLEGRWFVEIVSEHGNVDALGVFARRDRRGPRVRYGKELPVARTYLYRSWGACIPLQDHLFGALSRALTRGSCRCPLHCHREHDCDIMLDNAF